MEYPSEAGKNHKIHRFPGLNKSNTLTQKGKTDLAFMLENSIIILVAVLNGDCGTKRATSNGEAI